MAVNVMLTAQLTEHDLKKRKDHLTATDVPALMGTSPWKTAYDVWCEKCLDMEPLKPNLAMAWGSMLEDDILAFAEASLRLHLNMPGLKTTRVGTRRVHANGVMSCTLDARLIDMPEAIEAKTHQTVYYAADDDWGDEEFGSEIPQVYADQVAAQFACAPDIERIWVVVSIGKTQPMIYQKRRADMLARIVAIENTCCDFWDRYIVTNTPPDTSGPTLESIKRARPQIAIGEYAALDDRELVAFKAMATQCNDLKKRKDDMEAALRAKLILAGCSAGRSSGGHVAVLKTIERKPYTVAATSYTQLKVDLLGALR